VETILLKTLNENKLSRDLLVKARNGLARGVVSENRKACEDQVNHSNVERHASQNDTIVGRQWRLIEQCLEHEERQRRQFGCKRRHQNVSWNTSVITIMKMVTVSATQNIQYNVNICKYQIWETLTDMACYEISWPPMWDYWSIYWKEGNKQLLHNLMGSYNLSKQTQATEDRVKVFIFHLHSNSDIPTIHKVLYMLNEAR